LGFRKPAISPRAWRVPRNRRAPSRAFTPLRSGRLELTDLRLVDSFGRVEVLSWDIAYCRRC
jgi:hypothetical protein